MVGPHRPDGIQGMKHTGTTGPTKHQQALAQAWALQQAGQLEEAARRLETLLRGTNPPVQAAQGLGAICREMRNPMRAAEALQDALGRMPKSAELHVELGLCLASAGRLAEGGNAALRGVQIDPTLTRGWMALAQMSLDAFDPDAAAGYLERAVQSGAKGPAVAHLKGRIALKAGRGSEAVAALSEFLRAQPNHADGMCDLASALHLDGDDAAALPWLEKAMTLRPRWPRPVAARAQILASGGRKEEALALLEPLLAAEPAAPEVLLAEVRLATTPERRATAAERIRRALARGGVSRQMTAMLRLALGDLLEKEGRHPEAFAEYQAGNALYPRRYDPNFAIQQHRWIQEAFGPGRWETLARSSTASGLPIFIVGMPRSGTSLVEQILASHPWVHAGGELTEISRLQKMLQPRFKLSVPYPKCTSELTTAHLDVLAGEYLDRMRGLASGKKDAGDNLRVTDKMPGNYIHLGFIAMLIPGARVIHCVRDPVDTCLSCYTTPLTAGHPWSNDLQDLATAHRLKDETMAFWKRVAPIPILDVVYEELVEHPERVIRGMLEFLHLPWDESCLHHERTERIVHTASRDQARQPIYRSSIGRWKRFEEQVRPLQNALSAAGRLIDPTQA